MGVDTAVTVPDEMARRKSVLLFTPTTVPPPPLGQPDVRRDACEALDDRAVHAAVHDAPRLQQFVLDGQLSPPAVRRHVEERQSEFTVEAGTEAGGNGIRHGSLSTRRPGVPGMRAHSEWRTGPAPMCAGPDLEWTGSLCSPQDSGSVRWFSYS